MDSASTDPNFNAWVAIRAMIDFHKEDNEGSIGIRFDVLDSSGEVYTVTIQSKEDQTDRPGADRNVDRATA